MKILKKSYKLMCQVLRDQIIKRKINANKLNKKMQKFLKYKTKTQQNLSILKFVLENIYNIYRNMASLMNNKKIN